MTEHIEIIFNNDALARLYNKRKGRTLVIASKDNMPLDRELRDRLKEARLDNCISLVKEDKAEEESRALELMKENDG